MKRVLQAIAVILVAILLTIAYGGAPLFDFSVRWRAVFVIIGIAALVWAFLPDKNEK